MKLLRPVPCAEAACGHPWMGRVGPCGTTPHDHHCHGWSTQPIDASVLVPYVDLSCGDYFDVHVKKLMGLLPGSSLIEPLQQRLSLELMGSGQLLWLYRP